MLKSLVYLKEKYQKEQFDHLAKNDVL